MIALKKTRSIWTIYNRLIIRQAQLFSEKAPSEKPQTTEKDKASKSADKQKTHDFKSDHIIKQDKVEKDQQYQEMSFKFQREWKKIAQEKDDKQLKVLNEELTENQRRRVDLISDAILDLNTFELRYLMSSVRTRIMRTTSLDLMKLNIDWPSIKQLDDGQWPPNNPNWFLQQEAIAKLWPTGQAGLASIFGGFAMGGGGGAAPDQSIQAAGTPQQGAPAGDKKPAAAAAQGAAAKKPDGKPGAKPDAKGDKKDGKKEAAAQQNFNLELVKIDDSSKIKIIKEIRQLFALGLKDAKDKVEKLPCILKQNIKKSEAEELKEKLTKLGCTVNLI